MARSVDEKLEDPYSGSMCDRCSYLRQGDCYNELAGINLDDTARLEEFILRQPEDGICQRFYHSAGLSNVTKIALWMIDPEKAKETIY